MIKFQHINNASLLIVASILLSINSNSRQFANAFSYEECPQFVKEMTELQSIAWWSFIERGPIHIFLSYMKIKQESVLSQINECGWEQKPPASKEDTVVIRTPPELNEFNCYDSIYNYVQVLLQFNPNEDIYNQVETTERTVEGMISELSLAHSYCEEFSGNENPIYDPAFEIASLDETENRSFSEVICGQFDEEHLNEISSNKALKGLELFLTYMFLHVSTGDNLLSCSLPVVVRKLPLILTDGLKEEFLFDQLKVKAAFYQLAIQLTRKNYARVISNHKSIYRLLLEPILTQKKDFDPNTYIQSVYVAFHRLNLNYNSEMLQTEEMLIQLFNDLMSIQEVCEFSIRIQPSESHFTLKALQFLNESAGIRSLVKIIEEASNRQSIVDSFILHQRFVDMLNYWYKSERF